MNITIVPNRPFHPFLYLFNTMQNYNVLHVAIFVNANLLIYRVPDSGICHNFGCCIRLMLAVTPCATAPSSHPMHCVSLALWPATQTVVQSVKLPT